MFLHQIFYQGLKARIASWPTLVLGKNHLFFCLCGFHDVRIQMFARVCMMKGYLKKLCLCVSTADLFDILLPMLNIYQEFVRNHQYSLQILAHCKQNRDFDKLLKQYEAKPDCEERTLETFLTYPMFQVRLFVSLIYTRNKGRRICLLHRCSPEADFVVNFVFSQLEPSSSLHI